MILPSQNIIFYKIEFFALSSKIDEQNVEICIQKSSKQIQQIDKQARLETLCFLTSIFINFWVHFASQAGVKFSFFFQSFSSFFQVGAKRRPPAPQAHPRALQERPTYPPAVLFEADFESEDPDGVESVW